MFASTASAFAALMVHNVPATETTFCSTNAKLKGKELKESNDELNMVLDDLRMKPVADGFVVAAARASVVPNENAMRHDDSISQVAFTAWSCDNHFQILQSSSNLQ